MTRHLLVFLTLTTVAVAGQSITVDHVLRQAVNAPEVTAVERQLKGLEALEYNLPIVNNLEFRTRNNELLYNRQQYALRLDIENPFRVIQNRKYFEVRQQLGVLRRQRALKEVITGRYLMLSELIGAHGLLVIRRSQDSLKKKLAEVYSEKSGSAEFDAEDLIRARLEIISGQADLKEAEYEFAVLERKITADAGASGASIAGLTDHIGPEQIIRVIDSVRLGSDLTEISEKAAESELAARKVKVEESSFNLGWIQGMYAPYQITEGDKPAGVALGVSIPVFKKNKDNQARSKVQLLEEQTELDLMKIQAAGGFDERRESLRIKLRHYLEIREQLKSARDDQFSTLAAVSNYDPVPIIKLEAELLKFRVLLNKIESSILKEWILMLDQADVLIKSPLRNYLSPKITKLD
jgi:hypothetical protein